MEQPLARESGLRCRHGEHYRKGVCLLPPLGPNTEEGTAGWKGPREARICLQEAASLTIGLIGVALRKVFAGVRLQDNRARVALRGGRARVALRGGQVLCTAELVSGCVSALPANFRFGLQGKPVFPRTVHLAFPSTFPSTFTALIHFVENTTPSRVTPQYLLLMGLRRRSSWAAAGFS